MIKERPQKLKVQKLLSMLIMLVGLVLLAFMIIVEDEPGAIPLLLIVSGAGWHVVTRYRIRSLSS